ncbi:hypothetical protein [Desulfobacter latus]|uniref:Uncharacterized protein n=1 Tax=Desulfobacter latus TaxID=2292 RepID=A0A850SZ62_9BACT|nr:hypothetical protein [Desulfobacter latus]NWH06584.1 hypothetical protein [Desulfobacter latus]
MIRYRQPGFSARPSLDETESLQTDTMRFFAVICMCLMIIFSLVKSMPITRKTNSPRINTQKIVRDKITCLEQRVQTVGKTLAAMEQALQKAGNEHQQVKRLHSAFIEQITILQKKRDKIITQLETTKQAYTEKRQALGFIEDEIQRIKRGIQRLESKAEDLKQNIAGDVLVNPVAAKTKAEAEISPEKEKTGFSLGFSSDDALFSTLKTGNQVALYMRIKDRFWQFKTASVPWAFVPVSFSGRIYYMDRQTVPDKVIQASAQAVSVPGTNEILFGVSLSQGITRQISALMKGRKGGNIIIQSNGRVDFEN